MKRLSLFCAALFAAMTSFATVAYELNGGTISEYANAEAMYHDLNADYNTATSGTATWLWITDPTQIATGLPTQQATWDLTFFPNSTKWAWLGSYMDAVCADQGTTLPSSNAAFMRYNLAAFFCNTQRTGWPKSADYTLLGVGTPAAFQAYWKSGFANPTDPTEATVLNEPYKEGFTFDGWYAAADFSGDKVTSVDASTTGTLYAKWVEYIPTLAEVCAMPAGTATKASGVVTYIRGKNVYIQDASAAILLYMSANPTFTVGQKVLVSGSTKLYGGAPELEAVSEISAEAGELPAPLAFETLAALKDNALKHFGKRVSFMGLRIASYDDKGNAYVTDGVDTVQCYYMTPDQNTFAVGKKVNLTALCGYYNKFQFVGDVAGFELVVIGKPDTYNYPVRGDYSLTNKWLITDKQDNFAANKPGSTDFVRGMAAKDGKMYFINRERASITVVDGATGDMLDPIAITGEHLFQREYVSDSATMATDWQAAVTLPYNDIKFDNAGHCLIGACVSGNQNFQVYKVDLTTGAATVVVDERLYANPDFADNGFRFDAFGVYGDVDGDAIIMAQDANSFNAYKWTISNGVAGAAEQIDCALDPTADQSLLISDGAVSVTNYGTAPQIFPVDFNYFYIDGWSTLPMLFDMNGTLADDFVNCPSGVRVVNNEGDTCVMNVGHNGLVEFEVNGEYFLLMAATNTVGKPASAFALYKFADAAKAFDGLEPLWYFPAEGMGALTNGCRTAVPSVEVNGNKATLYVYTNNNGYGVYEFTSNADPNCLIKGLDKTYFATGEGWTADNDSHAEFANCKLTVTNVNGHQAAWQAQAFLGLKEGLTVGTSYKVSAKAKANVAVGGCTFKVSDPEAGLGVLNFDLEANVEKAIEVTGVCPENHSNQLVFDFGYAPAGSVIEVYDFEVEEVTALEDVKSSNMMKVIENGQLIIIVDGVRYNTLGTVIE